MQMLDTIGGGTTVCKAIIQNSSASQVLLLLALMHQKAVFLCGLTYESSFHKFNIKCVY